MTKIEKTEAAIMDCVDTCEGAPCPFMIDGFKDNERTAFLNLVAAGKIEMIESDGMILATAIEKKSFTISVDFRFGVDGLQIDKSFSTLAHSADEARENVQPQIDAVRNNHVQGLGCPIVYGVKVCNQ